MIEYMHHIGKQIETCACVIESLWDKEAIEPNFHNNKRSHLFVSIFSGAIMIWMIAMELYMCTRRPRICFIFRNHNSVLFITLPITIYRRIFIFHFFSILLISITTTSYMVFCFKYYQIISGKDTPGLIQGDILEAQRDVSNCSETKVRLHVWYWIHLYTNYDYIFKFFVITIRDYQVFVIAIFANLLCGWVQGIILDHNDDIYWKIWKWNIKLKTEQG